MQRYHISFGFLQLWLQRDWTKKIKDTQEPLFLQEDAVNWCASAVCWPVSENRSNEETLRKRFFAPPSADCSHREGSMPCEKNSAPRKEFPWNTDFFLCETWTKIALNWSPTFCLHLPYLVLSVIYQTTATSSCFRVWQCKRKENLDRASWETAWM